MAVDLKAILTEVSTQVLGVELSDALARAIVCDFFRDCHKLPPTQIELERILGENKVLIFHLKFLALLLRISSLGKALAKHQGSIPNSAAELEKFLNLVGDISPESLASNAFRQEEFLRKLLFVLQAPVLGEKHEMSSQRLEHLDSGRLKKLLAEQRLEQERQQKEWSERIARARESQRGSYE